MTAPLPQSPDIFELLDIEAREDTYSRLLVHLLRHSNGLLRRLLAHAFPSDTPAADAVDITLRHGLGEAGVVDLLLRDRAGRWVMFVESKLFSAEHGEQTCRYWKACEALVAPAGRVAGVFLTIAGDRSAHPRVAPLTHRELTGWIAEHRPEFHAHSALRIAADGYIQRAQAPLPVAADATVVRTLLQPSWGLVPRLAGVAALGEALHHGLPGGWTSDAITIQGKGHANPGLQFWQPGWWGTWLTNNRWTSDNHDIHLEVELTAAQPWLLKLHFETSPYHTLAELRTLAGHADFAAMRDAFRAALKARAADLPRWKMSNYPLQIAKLKLDVGPDLTVAELRQRFAPALAEIAPHIHAALAAAKETVRRCSPPAPSSYPPSSAP